MITLSRLLIPSLAVLAAAQSSSNLCSAENKCPESQPCCNQYGICGSGSACMDGCDPLSSYSLAACAPKPVCQNGVYYFHNNSRIAQLNDYLGDASKYDWIVSGAYSNNDSNLFLQMPQYSGGAVIASTNYVWYGKITAIAKSSRGAGVVSSFILLSDVKDEIDVEWVGSDLSTAQTNLYFQAYPFYENSANISGLSDTYDNWHTYVIDWTPDSITWSVDGVVGRVKTRNSTWNETSNIYNYPQTPARIQFSIWPGGNSTMPKG